VKRLLSFVLMLVCVLAFSGCKDNIAKTKYKGDTAKSYCYVSYVSSDGFVADINDLGRVFVEYANADDNIELFDTVIVEYSTDDLIEENGSYVAITGNEDHWSYRIQNPKKVRVADPSKGEPVFG